MNRSQSFTIALLCTLCMGIIFAIAPTPVQADESACAALTADVYSSPGCDEEMAEGTMPGVAPLNPDWTALSTYTFMRLENGDDAAAPIVIHNGAGGEPVRSIDPGFHFVTIINVVGDWIEINAGEWVRAVDLAEQDASMFAGVEITAPLEYPLMWMLVNAYSAEYPGGPQVIDTEYLHFRYERHNVYATVEVDGHNWYLIAPGEWVYHTWVAIAQPVEKPEGIESSRWIAVDLYEQTLVAFENDQMVFTTLISSGLPEWDTNEGLFNVWARFASDHMSGSEGADDFYYLENVPYTMYFDGDISLHGTYWHDGFGYRHSHGCVNMSITDAKWLFNWTNAEEWHEAPVYVFSSNQY